MEVKNEQYMTPPELARELYDDLCSTLVSGEDFHFIEPCVGSGNFWRCLPPNRRTGVELDEHLASKIKGVVCQDFLTFTPKLNVPPERRVVIGNPPFTNTRKGEGSRLSSCSLAAKFIIHALDIADTVAFILPYSFVRPSLRKTNVPVVRARDLGIVNFDLLIDKNAKVRCVWLVISKVLPRTERFQLFDVVNEHFIDSTQSPDYEFLSPVDGHRGNFFMNRWGSVGNVYEKPPQLPRLLRRDGKNHGRSDLAYLWILAKPGCLPTLRLTAECIRYYWRKLSAGNNASIGLKDFNCVYNAVKKGSIHIPSKMNTTNKYQPPTMMMRGLKRM